MLFSTKKEPSVRASLNWVEEASMPVLPTISMPLVCVNVGGCAIASENVNVILSLNYIQDKINYAKKTYNLCRYQV